MDTAPVPLTRDQIYAVFQQVIAQIDTLSSLRHITPAHLEQAFVLGAQSLDVCAQTLDMVGDPDGADAFRRHAAWLVDGARGPQDLFSLSTVARRLAADRLPSFFHALHS